MLAIICHHEPHFRFCLLSKESVDRGPDKVSNQPVVTALVDEQNGRRLLAMSEAAKYSAVEVLRNGRSVEIRAVEGDDGERLLEAFGRASAQTIHRRFFAVRRLTEEQVGFFVNVDFIKHVALVVSVNENMKHPIVGGGRYVVVTPTQAEVAFAVVDEYQGQGIGAALMHHLTAIARKAGLKEFVAEVLPENAPMLKVFKSSGLPMSTKREGGVISVTLAL